MAFKSDILEKIGEFFCLFYFVFGFFTIYTWACKELDQISNPTQTIEFWAPVSSVYGLMNLANFGLIVFCYMFSRKHRGQFVFINFESSLLFYILCIPLFIFSIVYLFFEIIWSIINTAVIGATYPFLLIIEILMFCGTVLLIIDNSRYRSIEYTSLIHKINKLTMLMTIVAMATYFLFHMTQQQIHNFINVSSQYEAYQEFYPPNYNRTNNFFYHNDIETYIQPLVILFCCSCLAYLVTLFYQNVLSLDDIGETSINSGLGRHSGSEEVLINNDGNRDQPGSNYNTIDSPEVVVPKPKISQQQSFAERSSEDSHRVSLSFRLPPMSLVVGILFITLAILAIAISFSLIDSVDTGLQETGNLIFSIFLIPVYVLSIALLFLQFKEIKRWPMMPDRESIVDKTLVWIGTAGQFIVALAELQFNIYNFNGSISTAAIIEATFLIIHTLMQSVLIGLAFDREWIHPEIKTWQEYICPSVGMLSINIGCLMFSIFAVQNPLPTKIKYNMLYLKIFGNGFNTIGLTLAILHRLHSSLIFGRMIVSTNR